MKKVRKKTEAKPQFGEIDLGISALISSLEGELKGESVASTNPVVVAKIPDEPKAERAPERVPSAFEKLATEEKWEELQSLCQEKMKGETGIESTQATLWWVRAQDRIGSVPLSMLSAPLDTATKEVLSIKSSLSTQDLASKQDDINKISLLCTTLLLEVAQKLKISGERETALSFAERAFRFEAKNRDIFLEYAKEELAILRKAVTKKEKNIHAARINYLVGVLAQHDTTQSKSKETQTSENNSALKGTLHRPLVTKKSANKIELVHEVQSIKPGARRRFALGTSALILTVILVLFRTTGSQSTILEEIASIDPSVRLRPEPVRVELALHLPEPTRIESVSDIDAIYYRMEDVHARGVDSLEKEILGETLEVSTQPRFREGSKARIREVIDMQGPLEGTQFEFARRPDRARLEHAAMLSRSAYPDDSVRVKGTERRPEKEQSEPIRGYPVRRFSPGRVYEIITATKVMSRPSFRSEYVSGIDRGARVAVEESLGEWLKLRSNQGRAGYILAQDATDTGEVVKER